MREVKPTQQATFAEHVQELRGRLFWVVMFLVAGAIAGYFIHDHLVAFLQRPLNDSLYYTTPGGAFSFVIKVCTVFGLVVALPMLIYQIFAFFGPLISLKTKRGVVLYVFGSFALAVGGIAFAYFISLPAALHFLVNFGGASNIESLITANEYFNFVLTYVAGFAVLFQVPLIILLIDKVKPLPPKSLFGSLRYVVLGSFIAAAVITPTPDPMNQILMAGPIILLYLLSASVVALRHVWRERRAVAKASHTAQTITSPVAVDSALKRPSLQPLPVQRVQQTPKLPASLVESQPAIVGKRPVQRRLYTDIIAPRQAHAPTRRIVEEPIVQSRPIIQPSPSRLISDFMVPQRSAQ